MPAMVVKRRSIRRGGILFAVGDAPCAIYEVHAGCFKTCVASENGREQVSGFHIVGDFMGLDGIGSERHGSEVVALEDSQVNVVTFAVMSQLSRESSAFQQWIHRLMSREGERCQQMMFLLGSLRAEERVAVFLLDLLERLNARGYSATAVNLCMTRDEIGSHLGLSLETVSRMLTLLKRSGTVVVTHREVRILNVTALRRVAAGPG